MSITNDFLTSAIENSATSLLGLSKSIKEVAFPDPTTVTIETSKLSDKYISDILKDIPAGYAKDYSETDFIYIFEIQDASSELKSQMFEGLCDLRGMQDSEGFEGKKDVCRPIHSQSEYLYVGRSQKLKSRLKQHLDAGSEGIFAMHLLRWGASIDARIKIYCYRFDRQPNLIIQALEDGLWDNFQPMFGRKGEK